MGLSATRKVRKRAGKCSGVPWLSAQRAGLSSCSLHEANLTLLVEKLVVRQSLLPLREPCKRSSHIIARHRCFWLSRREVNRTAGFSDRSDAWPFHFFSDWAAALESSQGGHELDTGMETLLATVSVASRALLRTGCAFWLPDACPPHSAPHAWPFLDDHIIISCSIVTLEHEVPVESLG